MPSLLSRLPHQLALFFLGWGGLVQPPNTHFGIYETFLGNPIWDLLYTMKLNNVHTEDVWNILHRKTKYFYTF